LRVASIPFASATTSAIVPGEPDTPAGATHAGSVTAELGDPHPAWPRTTKINAAMMPGAQGEYLVRV
jgi:hypothetical protein